ncbi:unnamed protein product [Periconia digitata]|uniref:Uncharacterized protein n=1 Tax=Periconia digitata TaxID=1303443 RepID=A0A9W4UQV0_9PLEO|nr:unnamed protein product [Periconia digitata]
MLSEQCPSCLVAVNRRHTGTYSYRSSSSADDDLFLQSSIYDSIGIESGYIMVMRFAPILRPFNLDSTSSLTAFQLPTCRTGQLLVTASLAVLEQNLHTCHFLNPVFLLVSFGGARLASFGACVLMYD